MADFDPDAFFRGIQYRVPSMRYAADVNLEGPYVLRFLNDAKTVLAAKSATYYASAVAMVNGSTVTITLAAGQILNSGLEAAKYGRGIQAVASAANARTLTLTGRDYLGSRLVETITLNGTTPVPSKNAYKLLESAVFSSDTDTTTVNIGQSDVLGLPYRGMASLAAILNDGAPTGQGTFVAGLADATTPTATTADVRGTWTPNASDIPNGTRDLKLSYLPDKDNLHGVAPFSG